MTGKEYLAEYRALNQSIQRTRETIQGLRLKVVSVPGSLKEVKVQGSSSANRLGDIVARIVDMESYLAELQNRKTAMMAKIYNTITQMPNIDHRVIMLDRYMEGKKWDVISSDFGLTERHCHRLHGEALLSFDEIYEKNNTKVT